MALNIKTEASGSEASRAAAKDLHARLTAFARRVQGAYDTRPVSKAEWDAASGDEE